MCSPPLHPYVIRRPPSPTLFPYTPLFRSNFTATPVSAARIDLAWSAAAGATSYRIERKGPNQSSFTELARSEEHTSELQSPCNLVCRLLLEKKIVHQTYYKHTAVKHYQ